MISKIATDTDSCESFALWIAALGALLVVIGDLLAFYGAIRALKQL